MSKIIFETSNVDYDPSSDALSVIVNRIECDHVETFAIAVSFCPRRITMTDITPEAGDNDLVYAAQVLQAYLIALDEQFENHPDSGMCAPNEYFDGKNLRFEIPNAA